MIPGGSGVAAPVAAAPVTLTALQSAIAEGAAMKSLPSNVTPALADAATDHPNTHGCMVGFDALAPPPDADCTFGDLAATRTMAVVGDSHANAWFPATLAFATEHHWRFVLYAKAACPPGIYPGYMNDQTNRVYTECDTWRSAMFDRVNALKPDVVIVTSQTRVVAVEPAGMAKTVDEFEGERGPGHLPGGHAVPGDHRRSRPGLPGRAPGRHPTVQPGSGRSTEPVWKP